MIRFIIRSNLNYSKNRFSFSSKNQYQKGLLKLSRFKLDQQKGGHLIYLSSKEKNFKIVSFCMIGGIFLSIFLYQLQDKMAGLIPVFISLGALIIYQKRIFNTIRQIIIDKTGEKMTLETYGLFGFPYYKKQMTIPIYLMKGVIKKSLNKGIAIRGGGSFGIKKFQFYFHDAGVLQRDVFHHVISGKSVKYTDKL